MIGMLTWYMYAKMTSGNAPDIPLKLSLNISVLLKLSEIDGTRTGSLLVKNRIMIAIAKYVLQSTPNTDEKRSALTSRGIDIGNNKPNVNTTPQIYPP